MKFVGWLLASAVGLSGCGGDDEIARAREPIEAACFGPREHSGWKCGESLVAECGAPVTLYVPEAWATDCDGLRAEPNVTWPAGDVSVSVVHPGIAGAICSAALSIRDTTPPQLEPRTVILSPPNHRFVEITPRDCARVFDVCDDDLRFEFTWVASDEGADDDGDGRPERDVMIECERLRLAAERDEDGNGRVYRVGVRAIDDAGLTVDGSCTVEVPYEVTGAAAIEDPPQYRIEAGACGQLP